jgi:energy-converting hydrogenase Eha subunit H
VSASDLHASYTPLTRLLHAFLQAADVVVSASDFEMVGHMAHEALLCGTPVVLERTGGFLSQVNKKKNYLLAFLLVQAYITGACSVAPRHASRARSHRRLSQPGFTSTVYLLFTSTVYLLYLLYEYNT